ncbi:outer membrane beta-barrel protein [Chitinophaga sp. SYP-B3965]|uniref:outer membrane beta-barrel protein n=1 Tax=Chitinophaga sp. SYP-B3965 TaxID=2663120 RepID=UPI001299AEAB|nr:outer membrane beta-barrel protein [Chitinophaga sp. SYP-B3965]MRG46237.1 outer membrane beta-barrel protein [Chitinophaga sp. SYP-B3965]
MRKIGHLTLILAAVLCSTATFAQTEKGNMLVGANLGNIGGTFQDGGNRFNLNLTPKLGWFIKDDVAIGGEVKLGLSTGEGVTNFTYGVGAFGRYYIKDKKVEVSKRARWFLEANAGINGVNTKTDLGSSNTNGLGIGFGPGLAYFITPNVGLEALLKYDLTVGFGSATTAHAVGVNVGFQIYLPTSKARQLYKEERANMKK